MNLSYDINTIISKAEENMGKELRESTKDFIKARFLGIGQDRSNDSLSRKLVLFVPKGTTDKQILDLAILLGLMVYGTDRCSHEHDCCGCWFGQPAKITRINTEDQNCQIVLVTESFYQNV